MSSIRIFIDFGSTFTKAVAFDLEQEALLARVQVPSTVDTDISVGLREAFDKLSETVPLDEEDIRCTVACSSAAGGLRMICIGLVPEYTTEAGRLAALGAGAKIVGTFSYEMTRDEAEEIERLKPDIVLLTGGTDGGNKKTIIHNARILAQIQNGVKNVIVAGNKSARSEIEDIFAGAHKNVSYAKKRHAGIRPSQPGPRQRKDTGPLHQPHHGRQGHFRRPGDDRRGLHADAVRRFGSGEAHR